MSHVGWIKADWPAPQNVRAGTTTRQGGISQGNYAGFNLALHVDDDAATVQHNRKQLTQRLRLPSEPQWLEQVHGCDVSTDDKPVTCADAISTTKAGHVCAVMTADCLPVVFCDLDGTCVAAAHAGWRGLAAGVLIQTLKTMPTSNERLMAWFGPAIGPKAFEVGDEVRAAFVEQSTEFSTAFSKVDEHHWLMDIYQAACIQLAAAGVERVYGGGLCTYSQRELFYSYRRDKQTGRMATLVWMEPGLSTGF
jgi:YfiH family protein